MFGALLLTRRLLDYPSCFVSPWSPCYAKKSLVCWAMPAIHVAQDYYRMSGTRSLTPRTEFYNSSVHVIAPRFFFFAEYHL